MDLFLNILAAFIPLFFAIDALGNMPIFVTLTEGYAEERKRRLVWLVVIVAGVVGFLFGAIGNAIFKFLGITAADFRVGGGLLLIAICLKELVAEQRVLKSDDDSDVGVFPLAIPLTIGPAALTTIVILQKEFGYFILSLALLLNLAIVWLAFTFSSSASRHIGPAAARAIAKIVAILLAAIAVMMVRTGIVEILQNLPRV